MKSIGIIAEYNPFHNGHLYQIKKIKEKYPNYALVVVMTGNFVERGDVSILDKWKKCEIALKYGIDLVIELPYPFACQSADFFAYGAITLLEKLNVERVIFGSESDDVNSLELIAKTQIENPNFENLVKIYSRLGNNYPTSLSLALNDLVGIKINEPNDLLGISYIKTILKNKYKIKYETIKRTNSYHDINLSNESISSATSIREALKNNIDISKYIPKDTISYYNNLHFIDDYFDILKYKIMTEDLSIYHTVEEGIDKLLKKNILKANNYDELIKLIKTKRYTYNKINRTLLHILCNFTKEKANLFKDISYIRILGFNDTGKSYLNSIKKDIDIPIISKICREKESMLDFEIETTKIYDIISNDNLFKKEFSKIIYMVGDKK